MEKILSRAKINHSQLEGVRIDLVLRASPEGDHFTWFSRYNNEEQDTETGGATIEQAESAAAIAWGADCWELEWVEDEPLSQKYYIISRENVGPDAEPLNKTVIIQDHPGTTNQSGEEKISGWLGTTNDCYESAQGEFASLEAAQKYIQKTWPGVSILDGYELEAGEVEA